MTEPITEYKKLVMHHVSMTYSSRKQNRFLKDVKTCLNKEIAPKFKSFISDFIWALHIKPQDFAIPHLMFNYESKSYKNLFEELPIICINKGEPVSKAYFDQGTQQIIRRRRLTFCTKYGRLLCMRYCTCNTNCSTLQFLNIINYRRRYPINTYITWHVYSKLLDAWLQLDNILSLKNLALCALLQNKQFQ